MEKQNVTISTLPVTIKIVEVAGKRMTLSVFKQIPKMDFILSNQDAEQRAKSVFGWTCIPRLGDYFIFGVDGILYKWFIKYPSLLHDKAIKIDNAITSWKLHLPNEHAKLRIDELTKEFLAIEDDYVKELLVREEIRSIHKNNKMQLYISI